MSDTWVWWKDGVIYQIYPRSFYDSNSDGVGDIPGIIEKLDYLLFLGVDAIWLSPINKSPMDDFGYDVKCYRSIHSIFGTDEDFDRLIQECHLRNIRIIFDLVINHTSDTHLWFLESRSSKYNAKRDWYIWNKGRQGSEPNNWLAAFGGSAWEYDTHTREYYLHSFLKEQPDLNWRNPEVLEAVFLDIRHWLDKGIDGFRLDVANYYMKDDKLRNNPYGWGWPPRKYELQQHQYDRNRPENHEIMQKMRSLLDEYDERMAVGEIFSMPPVDQSLPASYYGDGGNELHMAFDFSLMYIRWSALSFYRKISKWYKELPENGWPCFVLSNHDQPRHRSRFGKLGYSYEKARIAAYMLLTLRGTPFIYYGEEIGMRNVRIPLKKIKDPAGKKYWPFYAGRDPSRTPMHWDESLHAGFSETEPWLPVDKNYKKVNVKNQKDDPSSLLNVYRALIRLRRQFIALRRGLFKPIEKGIREILAYERKFEDQSIIVLLNFSRKKKIIFLQHYSHYHVLYSTRFKVNRFFRRVRYFMNPFEATILVKSGSKA